MIMVRGQFAQLLAPGLQQLFNTWIANPNAFVVPLNIVEEEIQEEPWSEELNLADATIIIHNDGEVEYIMK